MTLESQYKQFLKDNPDTTFSFKEWMSWHSHQMEQAIIKMMQDDEELGLYDYDWCKGNVVLPREEIKLEDVFNDEKREGVKKFIHEVKSIPKEEILANRCNAYEFLDFNKQETLEEAAEKEYPTIHEQYQYDAFIDGAKWQQERSYSEEDVKNAFLDGWQLRDGDLPFPKAKKKWFKEFKK